VLKTSENEHRPLTPKLGLPELPPKPPRLRVVTKPNAFHVVATTWATLLHSVRTKYQYLVHAVENNIESIYVDRAKQLIGSIRHILICTETLNPNSACLSADSRLTESHAQLTRYFSRLLISAIIAAGLWPPPRSEQEITIYAKVLYEEVVRYVKIAEKLPTVQLRSVKNDEHQFEAAEISEFLEDLVYRINSDAKSIISSLNNLHTFERDSSFSPTFFANIEITLSHIAALISLFETFECQTAKNEATENYKDKKSILYQCCQVLRLLAMHMTPLMCLVRACDDHSDENAPGPIQTQRLIIMETILELRKCVEEFVVATKLIIHAHSVDIFHTAYEVNNSQELCDTVKCVEPRFEGLEIMAISPVNINSSDGRNSFMKTHHRANTERPLFLTPKDIITDEKEKGEIIGATFPALVRKIVGAEYHPTLIDEFLATFHLFGSSQELTAELIEIYSNDEPDNVFTNCKTKVCDIVKKWKQNYWDATKDDVCADLFIAAIVNDHKIDVKPAIVETMASFLRNMNIPKLIQLPLEFPTPIIPNRTEYDFNEISAEEIARQLTLITYESFTQIPRKEFINIHLYLKKETKHMAPNISRMVNVSNRISYWTVDNILSNEKGTDRVKAIKKFTLIAQVSHIDISIALAIMISLPQMQYGPELHIRRSKDYIKHGN
jgi:RasGEF domain/RasGEF N-terminal motif